MDVPIGNQNTFCMVGVLRMPGGYRDSIKQAETHAASRARMVARRANSAESIAHLPRENRIDSGDSAARCDPGADSALRSNIGIARAELAAVLPDLRRRPSRQSRECWQTAHRCHQTRRLFRMPGAGIVLF